MSAGDVAEVLAAHELRWVRPYSAVCACGGWESHVDALAAHTAHVAAALRDAGLLRDEQDAAALGRVEEAMAIRTLAIRGVAIRWEREAACVEGHPLLRQTYAALARELRAVLAATDATEGEG